MKRLPEFLPMPENAYKVSQTEVYYHALYHLVGHWAAYVSIVGGLLTTAIILCVSPVPSSAHGRILVIAFAVALAFTAGLYFILRMRMYGQEVAARLPESYKRRLTNLRHNDRTIAVGIIGLTTLAVLNWAILYHIWQ